METAGCELFPRGASLASTIRMRLRSQPLLPVVYNRRVWVRVPRRRPRIVNVFVRREPRTQALDRFVAFRLRHTETFTIHGTGGFMREASHAAARGVYSAA